MKVYIFSDGRTGISIENDFSSKLFIKNGEEVKEILVVYDAVFNHPVNEITDPIDGAFVCGIDYKKKYFVMKDNESLYEIDSSLFAANVSNNDSSFSKSYSESRLKSGLKPFIKSDVKDINLLDGRVNSVRLKGLAYTDNRIYYLAISGHDQPVGFIDYQGNSIEWAGAQRDVSYIAQRYTNINPYTDSSGNQILCDIETGYRRETKGLPIYEAKSRYYNLAKDVKIIIGEYVYDYDKIKSDNYSPIYGHPFLFAKTKTNEELDDWNPWGKTDIKTYKVFSGPIDISDWFRAVNVDGLGYVLISRRCLLPTSEQVTSLVNSHVYDGNWFLFDIHTQRAREQLGRDSIIRLWDTTNPRLKPNLFYDYEKDCVVSLTGEEFEFDNGRFVLSCDNLENNILDTVDTKTIEASRTIIQNIGV